MGRTSIESAGAVARHRRTAILLFDGNRLLVSLSWIRLSLLKRFLSTLGWVLNWALSGPSVAESASVSLVSEDSEMRNWRSPVTSKDLREPSRESLAESFSDMVTCTGEAVVVPYEARVEDMVFDSGAVTAAGVGTRGADSSASVVPMSALTLS